MGDLNKGWIKLSRSVLDNDLLKNPVYMSVWIRLLLLANYEDHELVTRRHQYHVTVRRGQVFTSYGSLAKQTGVTVDQVRHAIKQFYANQMATRNPNPDGLWLTLENYEKFQCPPDANPTQNPTQNTTQNSENVPPIKEELTTEEVKEKNTMPSAGNEKDVGRSPEELMRIWNSMNSNQTTR